MDPWLLDLVLNKFILTSNKYFNKYLLQVVIKFDQLNTHSNNRSFI